MDGGNHICPNNRKKAEAIRNKTKAISLSTKQAAVRTGKMDITK
ncbi:hypothetical protein C2W59_01302 [Bacillus pumilus]|uniref:Uncharacterized protein n=1 Tax=Bacillus pumilus TaxID=1408 RepID=A0AB34R1J7_BACPU|nr:hypothetical protein BAT_3358 [Bacillus pumilus ATCC 7061]KIL22901.1 hypothetical protein B4127_0860 [Bacillus pumilus]RAP09084.1 hypothetical protein C2W58_00766 [Bacillus pumilus]RAP19059.1 hypothetical protein C2W59_01302 [Bacillus pumilus]